MKVQFVQRLHHIQLHESAVCAIPIGVHQLAEEGVTTLFFHDP